MKTPYAEKWVSDFYIGVFPKEELDKMIDDSVQSSLQTLEEHGDDIDWQIYFELKVLKKLEILEAKIREASFGQ